MHGYSSSPAAWGAAAAGSVFYDPGYSWDEPPVAKAGDNAMTNREPASPSAPWPPLPYADWRETCTTLHRWTQIVGKVRLALTPWINHSWQATFYVTVRGLTTS